jgi:hypothetical protein
MLLFFGRKICQLLMSDLFSIKTFILQSNTLETASISASVAQISEPPLFFLMLCTCPCSLDSGNGFFFNTFAVFWWTMILARFVFLLNEQRG